MSQPRGSVCAGLELLRDFGNVNLSVGLSPEDLKQAVQSSDALIIRSATKVNLSP